MAANPRIIFFGTPEFAVASLENLMADQFQVVAVVTAPDKPAGRGRKIQASPVKECAEKNSIPVLQPENLKNRQFLEELQSFKPDLFVVVAFRMLPKEVWQMPPMGTFNLHASLLPDYRGAAPINWAIINGEEETGVTTFLLRHEIDTGNILLQEKEPIHKNDTAGTLYNRLMNKGAKLVSETVRQIKDGSLSPTPQPEQNEAPTAPKITKSMCKIDWSRSAEYLYNFIRGLSPYPTAWTHLDNKVCKIFFAEVLPDKQSDLAPGEYKTDNKTYLHFQTGKGMLAITDLQMEGKQRMYIENFLIGAQL